MARKQARPVATKHATLDLLEKSCRACGHRLLVARHSHRKVTRLDGVYDLRIKVYQCLNRDRKSTRLNSSHDQISYAVFCLKKKKKKNKKIDVKKNKTLIDARLIQNSN